MPRSTQSKSSRMPGGNKTASITVRLSPKYRYALELMARMSRRTAGSVIEELIRDRVGSALQAIDAGPQNVEVQRLASILLGDHTKVGDVFLSTWDPRDGDRFINLATRAPGLLTEDEDVLWRLLKEASSLWHHGELKRDVVRKHWAAIRHAAKRGVTSLQSLITKE